MSSFSFFSLSQGALTYGDRRATELQDLSRCDFDNKVITTNSL